MPTIRVLPYTDDIAPYILAWHERHSNREFFRRCPPSCDWGTVDGIRQLFHKLWVIYADAVPVGLSGLFYHDPYSRTVEFGVMIDELACPRDRRASISKHVFAHIGSYVFNYLNCNKMLIKILPDRTTLKKYLTERGFILEGTLRENCMIDGKPHDELLYGALKKDYKEPTDGSII